MFDANARHLPDGRLFFAECHSIDPESNTLIELLKKGRIYLCEKLEDNPYDCRFRIFLDSTKRDYILIIEDFEDEENFDDYSLFVYSGCPDGTGFIDEEWKQKALDFLGGVWYD
ncbi:hypothetical protein VPLG_00042 [Vibrio phage eugene 12A10]|uniref:hypothetical protein n=1 Tax=Vibrio phage eugene 12A10 TaxID=573172 RepID=UPI000351DB65|nr:hypothetical protein VPLG_00042 [Vibrio phage eugene 12A10]AGN51481.1 hypothetical protein VPLG_00042 [Vibrio phage eugene 12A10]